MSNADTVYCRRCRSFRPCDKGSFIRSRMRNGRVACYFICGSCQSERIKATLRSHRSAERLALADLYRAPSPQKKNGQ